MNTSALCHPRGTLVFPVLIDVIYSLASFRVVTALGPNGPARDVSGNGIGGREAEPVPIVVADRSPARGEGIAAALLHAGLKPRTAVDVAHVGQGGDVRAAVVSFDSSEAAEDVRRLCSAWPDATVVALLPVATPVSSLAALQAGAVAVVAADAPLDQLVAVVIAALHGQVVVPRSIAQGLIALTETCLGAPALNERELMLLRRLVDGAPVSRIATELGYSSRSLYRQLQALYRRLGVTRRSEALALCVRQGLL